MKDTKTISIVFVLLLLSLLGLFYMSEGMFYIIYISSLTLSVFIFSLTKSSFGFMYLLAHTLGLGFFNTWITFYQKSSNVNQISIISEHVILITSLSTMWLLFHEVKKLKAKQRKMDREMQELKRYEASEQILTKSEFLTRTKLIMTGMNRRNEKGFILTLKVNEDKHYVRDSVYQTLAKATLKTIRGEYDLAGKHSEGSIMVLLQNTNEGGCEIVTKRLEENLGEVFNLENKPYSIDIKELNNEAYSNLSNEGLRA